MQQSHVVHRYNACSSFREFKTEEIRRQIEVMESAEASRTLEAPDCFLDDRLNYDIDTFAYDTSGLGEYPVKHFIQLKN